jgi:diaminopimelate decarboxylase
LNWEKLHNISGIHGDSYYLVEPSVYIKNYTDLLDSFRKYYPNSHIGYSYKTNYLPYLCKLIDELGGYAEVVSDFEYSLALKNGVNPIKIIVNGPYKKSEDLYKYLSNNSIVNLDSFYEIDLIENIAARNPTKKYGVGIRCNFEINESLSSRFGFDVEGDEFHSAVNKLMSFPNIDIKGLHCHFPNRDIESFRTRINRLLHLSEKLLNTTLDYIDVGGGYYGKMVDSLAAQFEGDIPDFNEYGYAVASRVEDYYRGYDQNDKPKLFLEPGGAIVGNTIKYVVKVIDIKVIRGQYIATTTGSRFNMGLFSSSAILPMERFGDPDSSQAPNKYESIHLAGYTCIENDYLMKNYRGIIRVGDYLVFSNVGSYSLVFKPPFILPNCAVLHYDLDCKSYVELKKAETLEDIMNTYKY